MDLHVFTSSLVFFSSLAFGYLADTSQISLVYLSYTLQIPPHNLAYILMISPSYLPDASQVLPGFCSDTLRYLSDTSQIDFRYFPDTSEIPLSYLSEISQVPLSYFSLGVRDSLPQLSFRSGAVAARARLLATAARPVAPPRSGPSAASRGASPAVAGPGVPEGQPPFLRHALAEAPCGVS